MVHLCSKILAVLQIFYRVQIVFFVVYFSILYMLSICDFLYLLRYLHLNYCIHYYYIYYISIYYYLLYIYYSYFLYRLIPLISFPYSSLFSLSLISLWTEVILSFNNKKSNSFSFELISLIHFMLTKLKNFENNISIATTVKFRLTPKMSNSRFTQFNFIWDKKSNHLTIYYSTPHKIICKELRNLFIKRYFKKIKYK